MGNPWDKPPGGGKAPEHPASPSPDNEAERDLYGEALARSFQNQLVMLSEGSSRRETEEERKERLENSLRINIQSASVGVDKVIPSLQQELEKWTAMTLRQVQKIIENQPIVSGVSRPSPELYKEERRAHAEESLRRAIENRIAFDYALEALKSGRDHEQAEKWVLDEEKKHAQVIQEAKALGKPQEVIDVLKRKKGRVTLALAKLREHWDLIQRREIK